MGRGHRWMYYATGLPGWMRFGFSPGWVGMSPYELGPGATYLTTGQWPTPQAQAYWQAMQSGQAPYPYPGAEYTPGFAPPMRPEDEIEMLKDQAEMLNDELNGINSRISELEKGKTK